MEESETDARWEGGSEGGGRTSCYRVEMTGTCFFTFLFLLSFLCFIKGNTKGKLCYLLKNVKVHFKREEKKQTHGCLDREGRPLTGRPEAGVVGDMLEPQAPLTSGFSSQEALVLPGHSGLSRELEDQGALCSLG